MTFKEARQLVENATSDDRLAVQACAAGVANARQAKTAFEWLLRDACCMTDNAFIASKSDAAERDFILGRQYVGEIVRGMLDPRIQKKEQGSPAGKRPIMSDAQAEQLATGTPTPSEAKRRKNVRGKR